MSEGFSLVEVGQDAAEKVKKVFKKKPLLIVGGVLIAGAGFYLLTRGGSEEVTSQDTGTGGYYVSPSLPEGSGLAGSAGNSFGGSAEISPELYLSLIDQLSLQDSSIQDLGSELEAFRRDQEAGLYQYTREAEPTEQKASMSAKKNSLLYNEGGIKYENRDGAIYKDGREIDEKDYKYIPSQVGGTRDDSKKKTDKNKNSSTKTYTEGGIKYENKGGVIYKNGNKVDPKNYKYIPAQVGGTRK